MNEDILINVTPQETRVAVMLQGVAQEIHIERSASRGLVGNVHVGRVARVLPGMQSAFIDIGLERAAFLHVADIWEVRHANHNGGGEPFGKAGAYAIQGRAAAWIQRIDGSDTGIMGLPLHETARLLRQARVVF